MEKMSEIKIKKITKQELKDLGLNISSWSNWDCNPSEFDWQYEGTETAYVFEGNVIVTPEDGKEVTIEGGNLVQFPNGMKCRWKVNKTIRKVYTFDKIEF
jgi:uncharacterized cupin superfamily protein